VRIFKGREGVDVSSADYGGRPLIDVNSTTLLVIKKRRYNGFCATDLEMVLADACASCDYPDLGFGAMPAGFPTTSCGPR
jgi:hypothetical protein